MDTNAKIIPITAQKVELGIVRLELNVYLPAIEVRYIHTRMDGQNYEFLIICNPNNNSKIFFYIIHQTICDSTLQTQEEIVQM